MKTAQTTSSTSIDNLPEATTIIFMGRNADFLKLPYSKL